MSTLKRSTIAVAALTATAALVVTPTAGAATTGAPASSGPTAIQLPLGKLGSLGLQKFTAGTATYVSPSYSSTPFGSGALFLSTDPANKSIGLTGLQLFPLLQESSGFSTKLSQDGLNVTSMLVLPGIDPQQMSLDLTKKHVELTLPILGKISSQDFLDKVNQGDVDAVALAKQLVQQGVTVPGIGHVGLDGASWNPSLLGFGTSGAINKNGGSITVSTPVGDVGAGLGIDKGSVTGSLDGSVGVLGSGGASHTTVTLGKDGVSGSTDNQVQLNNPIGDGGAGAGFDASGAAGRSGVNGSAGGTVGGSVGNDETGLATQTDLGGAVTANQNGANGTVNAGSESSASLGGVGGGVDASAAAGAGVSTQ